jgi:S-adenosylmethionine:tRNA ribosyltransferase-isomerase
MRASTTPNRRQNRRLLVIDERGSVSHHRVADLPRFVSRGDLLVANDAATLPAGLHGVHLPSGGVVEVRLAGWQSMASHRHFTAVMFGSGDHRTPTEHRPLPPHVRAGDGIALGPLHATVTAVHAHPRLIDLRFEHAAAEVWEGLARYGRPIQYSYVREPLALWDTWTAVAARPVAFEAPSAGFVLDWALLQAFRSRGIAFATLTHAAGISSTGDEELDRLLPLDEAFQIPVSTAALVNQTRNGGGRVIAVGTTVVRALEAAAGEDGRVMSGHGVATGRIGHASRLALVDAIVTGVHEPGTSHYELLRAFQSEERLRHMAAEADRNDYRLHEFGDSMFIASDRRERARRPKQAA